jgi:tetratricopeptide (TPR) repeat protein
MQSRLPRWAIIALIVLVVAAIGVGIFFLFWTGHAIIGWIVSGLIIAAIAIIAATTVPQLYKLYKFQKYFKQHENALNMLPSLMQSGRIQEAMVRFEGVMKHAPENAYIYYLRAFFLQAGGKQAEALSAANKAMSLVDKDPFLATLLQQQGGQMGQPTTVEGFKEQLRDLQHNLEPRVNQMRERRKQAAEKRKKKSR